MIRISDPSLNRTCAGYSRRDFLQIGSLGLAGLGLPGLLATKAAAAGSPGVLRANQWSCSSSTGGLPILNASIRR